MADILLAPDAIQAGVAFGPDLHGQGGSFAGLLGQAQGGGTWAVALIPCYGADADARSYLTSWQDNDSRFEGYGGEYNPWRWPLRINQQSLFVQNYVPTSGARKGGTQGDCMLHF